MRSKQLNLRRVTAACVLIAAAAALGSAALPAHAAASGDLNRDGSVNKADVLLLQAFLSGQSGSVSDWQAGDLSGDGRLTGDDLTLLKRSLMQ